MTSDDAFRVSDKEALKETCPVCAAGPGKPCTIIGSNEPRWPHYLRRDEVILKRLHAEAKKRT